MRIRTGLGMMILTLVAAASPMTRAGSLIQNGGFETPHVDHSTTFTAGDTSLSPWVIVSGSVDIVPAVPATGTGWPAFEGTQSLDLNGSVAFGNNGMGVIQQSFVTIPGQLYGLFFKYANNPEDGAITPTATVSVLDSNSATLESWDISHSGSSASSLAAMNYTPFAKTFVPDTALTTLVFASTFPGNFGIALDAVSASAVPEPGTLTLAAAGGIFMGGYWLLTRRRAA